MQADVGEILMDVWSFGRTLIILGLAIFLVGLVTVAVAKLGGGYRGFPGDIVYRKGNFSFFFPITTCLVLSAIVSFVLYFLGRIRH